MLIRYFNSKLSNEPLFALSRDEERGLVVTPLFAADTFNTNQFGLVLRAAVAVNEDLYTISLFGGDIELTAAKILRHLSDPDRNRIRREFIDDGEEL